MSGYTHIHRFIYIYIYIYIYRERERENEKDKESAEKIRNISFSLISLILEKKKTQWISIFMIIYNSSKFLMKIQPNMWEQEKKKRQRINDLLNVKINPKKIPKL